MADNVYECMFLFNANAYNRNPSGASAAIEDMVTAVGGEVLASRLFDERKLAYPVNGHRKGVYWLTYVKTEGSTLTKINRTCQLNDMILRHLMVKIDPRLVDTMVAVAQGKTPEVPVEEPVKEEKASEDKEKPAEAVAEG